MKLLIEELEVLTEREVVLVEDTDNIEHRFFTNPKKSMQELLDKNGYKVKVTKFLGSGTTGAAILGSDGFVYKLETNLGQEKLYDSMIGKKFKHLSNIYSMRDCEYPEEGGGVLKGIIVRKEYIPPMSKKLSKELGQAYLDTFAWCSGFPEDVKDVNLREQLIEVEKELMFLGFDDLGSSDAITNNFGEKDGRLILFDPENSLT